MKIKIHNKVKSSKGLLVVICSSEDLKKTPSLWPLGVKNFASKCQKTEEFKAKKSENCSTFTTKSLPEKLVLIGIGKKKNFNIRASLEIGGEIGKLCKASKKTGLSLIIPNSLEQFAPKIIQGIKMSIYKTDSYKTFDKKKKDYQLDIIEIVVTNGKGIKSEVEKALIIAEAVEYVRDLVNSPANKVNTDFLANSAKLIAKKKNYKIRILEEKDLKKQKWGALLAVNQGSEIPAKCIVMEYEGAKNKNSKPLALVGKGIVFDSGGYNLKPTNHIETMHQDMAGAAVVLGVFSVLSELGINKNIVGIIPVAENMINSRSYRPSDIIIGLSGKTIEVTNTDAEGRLILSDAITYATKLNPEKIITIATLTGAVMVALGDRYSGVMGNKKLRSALIKAGNAVDDLGWPLPLHRDFKKKMDSKIADVRNTDTGTSRLAGSSKGGAFLGKFIEKNEWCHIDIGGTAFTSDPKPYETKGATAAGLRMLLKYLES